LARQVVHPTLQRRESRFEAIRKCDRRRRVFIDAHQVDVSAPIAELEGQTKRPPLKAARDHERHCRSLGRDVLALEIDGPSGSVKMSAADHGVLSAGVRDAADRAVLIGHEVEQYFRRFSPASRNHRCGNGYDASLHQVLFEQLRSVPLVDARLAGRIAI
jgi:hypothetical protein